MVRAALLAVGVIAGCAITDNPAVVKPTEPEPESIADIDARDHRGQAVSLAEATARGPVVLVFYRGFW